MNDFLVKHPGLCKKIIIPTTLKWTRQAPSVKYYRKGSFSGARWAEHVDETLVLAPVESGFLYIANKFDTFESDQ